MNWYDQKEYSRLRRKIARVTDLPTLSAVANNILQETVREDASATTVAHHLAHDPALAASTLRLANSAYFGLVRHVSDVNQAVALLGFNQLRDIVMTASISNLLKRVKCQTFDPQAFWKHSVVTAIISGILAKRFLPLDSAADAFSAGLLHDIGKLFLVIYFPDEFGKTWDYARESDTQIQTAEMEQHGFHHGHVGDLLTESWKLPQRLQQAIRFHHNPLAMMAGKLAMVVNIANSLAYATLVGSGGNEQIPIIQSATAEAIGLQPHMITNIFMQITSAIEAAAGLFDVIDGN